MAENKKYELLENDTVKSWDGRTLKRIRALTAIAAIGVQAGDLGGYVETEKNLQVPGDAWVSGDARVYGDAQVSLSIHIGWFSHVGSEHGTLTWYRGKTGILVNRGCFSGTLEEFDAAVTKTHGDNQYGREYRSLIEFIRLRSADFSYEDMA